MRKERVKNELTNVRHEHGLSRKEVSDLLGYKGTSALAAYERGISQPPLKTLLALEIILRQPIAFLWPTLYRELREQIRAKEEGGQPNA